MRPTHTAPSATVLANLVAQAQADMAKYPQYKGHFAGYVLVRIERTITTKMGVAFRAGEMAIAAPVTHESVSAAGKAGRFATVYSHSNRCDTSVPADSVRPVDGLPLLTAEEVADFLAEEAAERRAACGGDDGYDADGNPL